MTLIYGKDAVFEDTFSKFSKYLAELGLDLEFTNELNPGPGLWSIVLKDKRSSIITTNGKGATLEAAKASALGEMAERFLNQAFFEDYWLGDAVAEAPIARYPDEKWFKYPANGGTIENYEFLCDAYKQISESFYNSFGDYEEYMTEDKEILENYAGIFAPAIGEDNLEDKKLEPIPNGLFYPEFKKELAFKTCRPFTDQVTANIERGICAIPLKLEKGFKLHSGVTTAYFPVRYLEGQYCSNGLCAGNTPAEAKVQGLSEIFERFVRRFLFGQVSSKMHKKLSTIINRALPEIPKTYLQTHFPQAESYIKTFAEKGISIKCFDASLGGLFPVAAVLAYKNSRSASVKPYKLSIGSHPDIKIALERCFTELMQGLNWDTLEFHTDLISLSGPETNGIEGYTLPKNPTDEDYEMAWLFSADACDYRNENFVRNYMDDSGRACISFFKYKTKFEFCDWSYSNHSTEEQLTHLLSIFAKLGKTVWCYDASYKDMYAYRLIVPEFSEIYNFESAEFACECCNKALVRTLIGGCTSLATKEWKYLLLDACEHVSWYSSLGKHYGLIPDQNNPITHISTQFFTEIQSTLDQLAQEGITEFSIPEEFLALSQQEKNELAKITAYMYEVAPVYTALGDPRDKNQKADYSGFDPKLVKLATENRGQPWLLFTFAKVSPDLHELHEQKMLQTIYLDFMKNKECNKSCATATN